MAVIRNAVRVMERTLSREHVERARSEAAVEIRQIRLTELRKKLGIRQADLGSFSQSAISRLEARSDMKLSTLATYLENLGLGMEIKVYRKNGGKANREEFTLLKTR